MTIGMSVIAGPERPWRSRTWIASHALAMTRAIDLVTPRTTYVFIADNSGIPFELIQFKN